MKGFWKFFDKLSDIMAALAGVLLVLISAAMCYTIFMRFVFRQTTIWIIPMSEYALLWIVFLGTTWLLREGRAYYDRHDIHSSDEKAKRYLNLIMSVVGGLTCAFWLYFGFVHVATALYAA